MLVLRDRAVDSIGPILEPHGQLLPLACAEARLVVFDAQVLPGVLDEERSELVRFGTGRIMKLKVPMFRSSYPQGAGAFEVGRLQLCHGRSG